jgi:hypothetical protein
MKNLECIVIICLSIISKTVLAQKIDLNENTLLPNHVYMSFEKLDGKKVLKLIKDSTVTPVDEPTFVRIKDTNFKNGVIEVKVLSRLLKNAPPTARGFIGVAFRIDDKNTKYESIYIRPTNGRADDQVRRNHSVQYYSYPDFKFDKLRQISPEKYESYADMGLNEWITMRIEVKDQEAKLFLNNGKYPVLIVKDLKLGENIVTPSRDGAQGDKGGIGLWVEIGTEGYFRDLKVIKQ